MSLEGHDVVDSEIATVVLNGVFFYSSDETGTSKDPYIVITYTEAPVADATFYEPLMMGVIE